VEKIMPTCRWTIDMREAKPYKFNKIKYKACLRDIEKRFMNAYKWDGIIKRRDQIMHQKYYEGFNVGREKAMFQQELKDLETVYKTALENYEKEIEDILPSHLYYMEKFLTLKKQHEAISEKLEDLLEKTGRKPQDEDGDNE
jgi:hypothetical protein